MNDTAVFTHRAATREDLPRIVEIYNSTIASRTVTADLVPVSVTDRIPWFDAHRPGHRPLWVAEIDGAIAGWLSFSSFYGRPAYDRTAELSLYLHENQRGRGLGRYLLDQALAHAPRIGVDTLLGFIFASNRRSLRLFAACGFERWGLLPKVAELDGVRVDVVIVGRHL